VATLAGATAMKMGEHLGGSRHTGFKRQPRDRLFVRC
jgi:hypothetical protein